MRLSFPLPELDVVFSPCKCGCCAVLALQCLFGTPANWPRLLSLYVSLRKRTPHARRAIAMALLASIFSPVFCLQASLFFTTYSFFVASLLSLILRLSRPPLEARSCNARANRGVGLKSRRRNNGSTRLQLPRLPLSISPPQVTKWPKEDFPNTKCLPKMTVDGRPATVPLVFHLTRQTTGCHHPDLENRWGIPVCVCLTRCGFRKPTCVSWRGRQVMRQLSRVRREQISGGKWLCRNGWLLFSISKSGKN